jgi:uncharacterized protein (DUF2062 family)
VKTCIVIPCYNHAETVGAVVRAALAHGPVIVVDDGSTQPLPELPGARLIRLMPNQGKGAALRTAFAAAAAEGYTHAVTMDADGQHQAADIPQFLDLVRQHPEALLVGVRDFVAAGAPKGRRRANAFSNFWFRLETGVPLGDTQCGFRCYPLALVNRLWVSTGRYAFELELMVRAAWSGARLLPVPVQCSYAPEQVRHSHFRPVVDMVRFSRLNMKLVLQAFLVPQRLRAAWSVGEHWRLGRVLREFFAEHAHEPMRLALAVGLGLFCGIAPIWGYQMLVAAALAHWLRLNKAIALLASNISIPPIAPFILYGGLALGHWMFTGQQLVFSREMLTWERLVQHGYEWFLGSFALALGAALVGITLTYLIARLVRSSACCRRAEDQP